MKILWLSESGFQGKVPRDFDNMRTEMAWYQASNGEHHHIGELPNIEDNKYDVAIIILPKNEGLLARMSTYSGFDLIGNMKRVAKKVGWMQEGPVTFFQDYSVSIQVWWYSVLSAMDFLMVHNVRDRNYIEGLFNNKQIFVNRSLIIEDALPPRLWQEDCSKVIIGGNFVSWYGGWDSYMVATQFETDILAPSMGRMKEDEGQVQGLKHIEYKTWKDWMYALSSIKYAVHLMPTFAAGTFALNCAYNGIPCIGYKGLDTQELLHPYTTVDLYDLPAAHSIANDLKNDEEFYNKCSEQTKKLYKDLYSEEIWKRSFFGFINNIIKEHI